MSVSVVLPYDCVNRVFEYLAQLLDSKLYLSLDKNGKMHKHYNRYYSKFLPIHNIFDYKYHTITYCNMGGQYKNVNLRFALSGMSIQVEALQNYRSIVGQDQYNANAMNGIADCGVCYTYTNPVSNELEVIYVDWRARLENNDEFTLLNGALYRKGEEYAYKVQDYELLDNGTIEVTVREHAFDWEFDWEGDDNLLIEQADDILSALEEEVEELVDFAELSEEAPLNMYM
jgi:hypothetical protein